jgi:hypothetical protein
MVTAPSYSAGKDFGNPLIRGTESAWSEAFPLVTLVNLENSSLIGILEKIALGEIRIARGSFFVFFPEVPEENT